MSRIASIPTAPVVRIAPTFVAGEAALAELRARRAARRILRSLVRGKWHRALIDGGITQHRYRSVLRSLPDGTEVDKKLLLGVNVLSTSYMMHADMLALRPVLTSTPDGHDEQDAAIESIRRRTLFDALYHEAALKCYEEVESALAVERHEGRTDIHGGDNDEAHHVGGPGPGGQRTVWESRWIVERTEPGASEPTRYLRIERHRAPGGIGIVEQEAYRTQSTDVLTSTVDLVRVPLDRALGPGHGLADSTPTGLPYPLITQLATYRRHGRPQGTLGEADLHLVDAMVAAMSRTARIMDLHASPKLRVPQAMIQDGQVEIHEAFYDPDRMAEYLQASFQFDAVRQHFAMVMQWLISRVGMAAALLGFKPDGGAAPDSHDKLRLESTLPLAYARRVSVLHSAALSRVFTVASWVESRSTEGWPVADVVATVRADLPKDQVTIAREQGELLDRRLTSEWRAVAAVHGDAVADQVMAEIQEDRERATARAQQSLMGSAFGDPVAGGAA